MMKNYFFLLITTLLFTSCATSQQATKNTFAKGADVGWLPQMEATGYKFYDSDGNEKDCLQLLKDRGMNSIRLRVFVNPNDDKASGHCSKEETITMALVYNHTFDVINSLKKAGVTPEWVQIGNEIPGGMLWPDGSTNNWVQLGQLLNKGYDAVKAVDKKIKIIVHVDEGNNNPKFRAFFDNATAQKVRYDVIGLSYYPYWIKKDYSETIADLQFNLNDMAQRYNKEVMIVEVGGEDDKIQNTYELLAATIKAVKNVPNNKGIGVLYWEPQGARSWSHYALSAWLPDGKPSPALDAFKE